MDRARNEAVRTKVGMERDILQETEEHQLRFCGHNMRMEDCRIASQVAEWNPQSSQHTAGWDDRRYAKDANLQE
jgi:hypothetical protein